MLSFECGQSWYCGGGGGCSCGDGDDGCGGNNVGETVRCNTGTSAASLLLLLVVSDGMMD